jgi:hypothetical protein
MPRTPRGLARPGAPATPAALAIAGFELALESSRPRGNAVADVRPVAMRTLPVPCTAIVTVRGPVDLADLRPGVTLAGAQPRSCDRQEVNLAGVALVGCVSELWGTVRHCRALAGMRLLRLVAVPVSLFAPVAARVAVESQSQCPLIIRHVEAELPAGVLPC